MIDTSTQQDIRFPDDVMQKVQEIIKRYPEGKQKSALLPILHLAQAQWRWLSPAVMDYVASILSLEPIEVYEVATFYTMFHLEPVGKHVLEVCRTGPCMICGGDELLAYIKQKLGIEEGETTADGMFTLKTVECLAACGTAPVLQIREQYHENLTPEKIDEMIDTLRKQG